MQILQPNQQPSSALARRGSDDANPVALHSSPPARQAGFTLVELMIALVILAVVSAVAIPFYTQYSVRTYRTEGQSDLLLCAQGMEKHAGVNFTYAGAVDTDNDGTGDADTGTVSLNICAPTSTRYTLAVQSADANTFVLRATPVAGSPVANDGKMEIDAMGNRRWDKNNNNNLSEAGEDNWSE